MQTPETQLFRSTNALKVVISGIQDDYVVKQSQKRVQEFINSVHPLPWAKITVLTDYICATVPGQDLILEAVKAQIAKGLALNILIMPEQAMSQWQVENMIKSVGSPDLFVIADSLEAGVVILQERGFDNDFNKWHTFPNQKLKL